MSVSKLILGTAGLGGMPYGRDKRIVSETTACGIIHRALKAGITAFDTAPAYGNAEEILGAVLARRAKEVFTIFTKTSGDRDEAVNSVARLGPHAPTFLLHSKPMLGRPLSPYPDWIEGCTVYRNQLQGCDIRRWIQVDWNLLSQPNMSQCERAIGRSVFLQGILAGACPPPILERDVARARTMASAYGLSLHAFALKMALQNFDLDYVVIGPTSEAELDDCLEIAESPRVGVPNMFLQMLDVGETNATDPRTWE